MSGTIWLCVDNRDGRVGGAHWEEQLSSGWVRYDGVIPENLYNNCCDYILTDDGELVYDPMPIPEPEEPPKNELEELIDILLGGEE